MKAIYRFFNEFIIFCKNYYDNNNHFSSLPNEIIVEIFTYLTLAELISIARLNKQFNHAACNNQLLFFHNNQLRQQTAIFQPQLEYKYFLNHARKKTSSSYYEKFIKFAYKHLDYIQLDRLEYLQYMIDHPIVSLPLKSHQPAIIGYLFFLSDELLVIHSLKNTLPDSIQALHTLICETIWNTLKLDQLPPREEEIKYASAFHDYLQHYIHDHAQDIEIVWLLEYVKMIHQIQKEGLAKFHPDENQKIMLLLISIRNDFSFMPKSIQAKASFH